MNIVSPWYSTGAHIDFYSEIENDSEEETGDIVPTCMITHQPLTDHPVRLLCGHTFNYDAIFNDAFNHKKKFYQLETSRLKEHQIRCPYCRSIQNHLLPCYPDKQKVHGINVNGNIVKNTSPHMQIPSLYGYHYNDFAKGYCCHDISNINEFVAIPETVLKCIDTNVKYNPINEMVYCKKHYKQVTDTYFTEEIKKVKSAAQKEKNELASIVKRERAIAKDKLRIQGKRDALSTMLTTLQSMKAFHKTGAISDNIVGGYQPIATESTLDTYVKPMIRCVTTTSGATLCRCKLMAIKGSVYCKRHRNTIV